jgi:thymidylate synthase (FAD)
MSLARLIWITPEAEEQIVYCARVSNPKSQEEGKSPDRLIRYLAKHKHWSPFEMASMCVEINTTRDIAAQILRHRSFSFQEFSQRYSPTDLLGKAVVPELRLQDKTNKQNSLLPDKDDYAQMCELGQFESEIDDLFDWAEDLYLRLLEAGVAKECARKVLPLNTPTRLYMSGTIRSWIHYLQIRGGVETQIEHREIAVAIGHIFKDHLPSIHEALLCPTESTLPSAKPNESPLSPPQGVRTGWRLKGFFERPVNLLKQYLAVLPLKGL